MWLIDTKSLTLKFVANSKDPEHEYAILSHTWEDDEVTFQEFQAGKGKKTRGYKKITNTCRQALRDGFGYAWVDTCCINKESSAELSEAINSMWQWYCDAGVCYAYLFDLHENCPEILDDDAKHGKQQSLWFDALGRCRWFTRGWTVQELIAPDNLNFYNTHWNFVGNKAGLIMTLSDITGIDAIVLKKRNFLSTTVVARKISWAARRETSRVEDRAYCMFGLLEINLPLLYGEGERAFVRLQEEIIRTTTDISVLAWHQTFWLRRGDLLFASSPEQFASCKSIVPWRGEMDAHYRLTNSGIAFDDLQIAEDDEGTFAILNCRYEDDLRGPIALRLAHKEHISFGNPELITNTDFWVDSESGIRRAMVFCDTHPVKRCKRAITILRHHPVLRPVHLSLPKIWVLSSDSSSDNFQIVHAHPSKRWNMTTGVMIVPFRFHLHEVVTGGVVLAFGDRLPNICLQFRIPTIEFNMALHPVRTKSHICMSQEPHMLDDESALDAAEPGAGAAEMIDKFGNRYHALLNVLEIMGDIVYKIEVSVAPGARSCSGSLLTESTAGTAE